MYLTAYIPCTMTSRDHNISREGEYLTAYIPCTNTLHQVTPVNYRILMDSILLVIMDDRTVNM